MFCPYCGTELTLKEGMKYCSKCGKQIQAENDKAEVGKTCPFCQASIKPGQEVTTCDHCRISHHTKCWRENQGCTTDGCLGRAGDYVVRPTITAEPGHFPLQPDKSKVKIQPDTDKKGIKSSFWLLETLLWWKVEKEELKKQVEDYSTLNIFYSARGASVLCLLLSVVVTFLFIIFGGMSAGGYIDITISLILALFIYFGHRWAMIATMLFWSVEKGSAIYLSASSGNDFGFQFWISLIWWAIYMHFFWLAYKVEIERRKVNTITVDL